MPAGCVVDAGLVDTAFDKVNGKGKGEGRDDGDGGGLGNVDGKAGKRREKGRKPDFYQES